ncbi:MAG: glutathione S-transferase [Polyangiales bacterium]
MTPILYIGNYNYSSWSMRPWLALRWAGLGFETRVIKLGADGYGYGTMPEILAVSPSGTVPALHLGDEVINDSLAISEWAAEQHRALWPSDPLARAKARSITCEMHSGFGNIRNTLPCNVRRRAAPRELSEGVLREVARLSKAWVGLRERFGQSGPYLFGTRTIADAFFTPMATRFRTYAVPLEAAAQQYVDTLLADPEFREWESAAVQESWTIAESDAA